MLKTPATLKLGCVGSKSKINFGMTMTIQFESAEISTYLDIANIDQHDVIMGIPYMTNNKISLDVPNKTIVIDNQRCIQALPPTGTTTQTTKAKPLTNSEKTK